MKHTSRILTLLALGIIASSALSGCGVADTSRTDESGASAEVESATEIATEAPAEMACTVRVQDYTGAPMADVVVKVMKNDEQVKMNVTKADGLVSFKLSPDTYEVSLSSTTGSFYYDAKAATLSDTTKDLTLTLYHRPGENDKIPIWPQGDENSAVVVSEGATYCPMAGDMTYFAFRPTREGVYEVSYVSDQAIDIGYYGSPMVVFDQKMLDTVDNKVTLTVRASSISTDGGATAMFVFGLKPELASTDGCIVTVTRTGDVEKSPVDEPWIEYKPTQAKAYEGTVSGVLTDIDVTNPTVTAVYNEADGYYHYGSADGPVVFIRISTSSPYLDALTTVAEKSRVGVYQYDETGAFTGKESYHDMIAAYAAIVNADGVCPLTPELEYMIKTFGEYQKWWDLSFSGNIFQNKIVTPETAWLFICCYYA